jgi:hypothetical protein
MSFMGVDCADDGGLITLMNDGDYADGVRWVAVGGFSFLQLITLITLIGALILNTDSLITQIL